MTQVCKAEIRKYSLLTVLRTTVALSVDDFGKIKVVIIFSFDMLDGGTVEKKSILFEISVMLI